MKLVAEIHTSPRHAQTVLFTPDGTEIITGLALTPDGNMLVTGSTDKTVRP